MQETENHSTGPRTEEGKQRSSQNAIKHGIFARVLIIEGENQEEFDQLLAGYRDNYQPKGGPEQDFVRTLAETEWRRRRIPALEAKALEKSLAADDLECKFLNTYTIYEQRLQRTFERTLKLFEAARDARLKEIALHFRIAAAIQNDQKKQGIPWNPADDGFVFSTPLIDQALQLYRKIVSANKHDGIKIEGEEMELFMAKDVQ